MGAPGDPIAVVNNSATSQYETTVGGLTAFLSYELRGNRIALIHTEVPQALSGRGIAGALARFALDEARARGWTVIPECEYVQAWLRRHADYMDLIAEPWRTRLSQPEP